MKILVLEYVTSGGMRQMPIPPGLAAEGGLMRRALTADLLALPDVALIILHDDRLPAFGHDERIETVPIASAADFEIAWRQAINQADADAVWVIAPETGGELERLCLDVERAGKALLTSPAAAVRIAASKLATLQRLGDAGLLTVPTIALAAFDPAYPALQEAALIKQFVMREVAALFSRNAHAPSGQRTHGFVIKPNDGAGCEDTLILDDLPDWQSVANPDNLIVQPLLTGESLSLSVLFAQGQARLCSVNRQLIEQSATGFTLAGCEVNAVADGDSAWQTLADRVAQALPELWGYAGIDLIQTADCPVILEVNPRLTTSYAGLRESTGENPAALVLDLLRTGLLPAPRRHSGQAVGILLEPNHGD